MRINSFLKSAPVFLLVFCFFGSPLVYAANQSPTEKIAEAWKKFQDAFAQKKNKVKGAVKTFPKESMLGTLRLQGIVSGSHGGGDIAIFNGEYYRVGETAGEYKILAIHSASVDAENLKDGKHATAWVVGTDFERNSADLTSKAS